MATSYAGAAQSYTGNWVALALRAAASILLGIIAISLPGPTLAALVILFGVYAFVDGVFAIIAAIRGVRRGERWGALLAEGIVGIIAGLIALFMPLVGALALVYLVAGWAFVTGALEIAAAIRLRKIMKGEWLMIIGGALSILLALLVAIFPGLGMTLLVVWIAAYALAYGAIALALAIRVRHWTHAHAHA
jgi:uncharacterized membrane protein HdeD (DUF308 family)